MNNTKVTIRPFVMEDKKRIALLLNNRKIWDNLRDYIPHPYTVKDAEAYITFCNEADPPTNFAIEYQGELVGSIGLVLKTDVYRKSAEIGYWLGEDYWGKGIASHAVKLMVDYGFQHLDIVKIYSGIFSFNVASQKVLEKNGFEKEGILKKAIYKNGQFCDEIRYSKLK